MSDYKTTQVGDATEFSTTPDVVPSALGFLAIPGVLLVLICLAAGIVYAIVAAGFVYGAAHLLQNAKQQKLYRTPATFRVSKDGIVVGGTTIPKDSIHRVIIHNHLFDSVKNLVIVADARPNSGQANTVSGMNWALSKVGPISYRVDVEARGVVTTLAGGLTEPVASAILFDVSKILQLP